MLLPDPDKVLEGSGKQVRYLSLRVAEKIPQEALRELVLAALALPPGR